jgi:hypothetical protein
MSTKSDTPRRPRGTPANVNRPSRQRMRVTFDHLVSQNPRLASSVLASLKLISSVHRQRAMQLIEAVSAVVVSSPRGAPDDEPGRWCCEAPASGTGSGTGHRDAAKR